MKITQHTLIEELLSMTQEIVNQAEKYKLLPMDQVSWKPNLKSWSILECLEHLNLFGEFYLDEIKKRMENSNKKANLFFRSGLFGNYFANAMLPKNGKAKKIKTFRDKDPSNSTLPPETIDRFLKQQQQMLKLLKEAEQYDLNKIKTSIAIPVVKIKLGDTFRVIIHHNQRHIWQAENVLIKYKG